jgi:nucleoside phosphorylase
MEDVVVFVAVPWERRAVRSALGASGSPVAPGTWTLGLAGGRSGVLIEMGIGAWRARAAALAAPKARAWVAMGCSGALATWLGRGQAIAADEVVVLDGGARVVDRVALAGGPFAGAAAHRGVRVIAGPIAASPDVLTTAGAKAAAAAASGALAVDMESGALATVARDRGVPFHSLRAVLDLADESLPFGPDVVDERTGTVRLGPAIRTLALPSQWPVAVRLVRGQRAAARALGALARVIAEDGVPEPALTRRTATA